jgi:hypothetical protein
MKPIREYLSQLPSPYNTLALSVVDENFISYKAEVDSLENAIFSMCDWDTTPQKWSFWNAVVNWCTDPTRYQLTPIPVEQVEKPKYFKHKVGGFIIEVTSIVGDIFEGVIVECNEHSTWLKKGEKRTDLNVKYFEPCDYTPAVKVSPEVEQENVQDSKPTSEQIASYVLGLIVKNEKLEQENTELRAKLAEVLSNPK